MNKKISVLTAVNTVVNIIVSMAIGIIISRGLTVEDRGVVFLAFQVSLISSVIFTFGTSQSIVVAQKVSHENVVRSFILAISIFVGISLLFVGFRDCILIYTEKIFGLSLPEDQSVLFISCVMMMVLFSILTSKVQSCESGIERSLQIGILGNTFYLFIFLWIYYTSVLSIEICLYIFLVSYLFRNFISILLLKDIAVKNISFNTIFLKKYITDSGLFWVNVVCFIVFSKINLLIAGRYLNETDFGIYSVSLTIIEIVGILPSAIGTVLFPYMVKNSFSDADDRIKSVSRLMFEIALVAALFVFVFGYWIITYLYGLSYVDSYVPLLIMLPGSVLLSVVFAFTNFLNSTGKTMKSNIVYLICIFLTYAVSVPLISMFHVYGASFTYTLCCFITFISFLYVCNNGFKNASSYLTLKIKKSIIYNAVLQNIRK